jgi:Helicase conserved C-terminal domain
MKNGRPANLFPLLKAVKHPFGNHQRAYEAHFCGGRDVSYGGRTVWMATGGANLDQLRCLTQSHMLHMTKDDCLKNLPKQSRVFKEVPVSSRAQMRHNEAMQKLAKAYENRQESSQEAILGAVQNLRLIDSFAKVDATVEIAKDVLIKEAAVVIFTSFVDVAKMLFQKLSDSGWHGELLTGETPAKKRQAMVDNFQNGLSAVFCCTFGAGGVGLTLTAASTVILLDRPWTPGDAHQAEDRVRRIGQTKPVTSIWMSAFELDKQIDIMLESKSQTSSTVLSAQNRNTTSANLGSNPDLMAHAPKLSILKLLQSILPSAKQSSSFDGLKQTSMLQYSQGSPRQKLKRIA